jgi:hypothetical protein
MKGIYSSYADVERGIKSLSAYVYLKIYATVFVIDLPSVDG